MDIVRSTDEAYCEDLSDQLEAQWPTPRSSAKKRILMALYEIGSVRYVVFEKGEVVGVAAIKQRWSRMHIMQFGSVLSGVGRRLYNKIKNHRLETVATNFSKGFWKKMGMFPKPGSYHNVFIN